MSPPPPSILVSQTAEELVGNLMEDSGQGLDISESRVVNSTSDEEEESREVDSLRPSRGVERRRPRRSRVAYKVGAGSRKIRVRPSGREQDGGSKKIRVRPSGREQ